MSYGLRTDWTDVTPAERQTPLSAGKPSVDAMFATLQYHLSTLLLLLLLMTMMLAACMRCTP